MTIWEDKETGEIHWGKEEYQSLFTTVEKLKTDVMQMKMQLQQLKKHLGLK